jgi:hypothetical protein
MFKHSPSLRLLKKVQLQGGKRWAGYPPRVGPVVLQVRRNECPNAPTQQMGLFQQPAAHFPIDIIATITGPQAVSRMFPTA